MRKILTSVLGVAGLMAVVLAASAGPATAQTVVVFETDTQPGSYTVSWATQGNCDPSDPGDGSTLATDGASGSISRIVGVPSGTADTASVADTTPVVGADVEFSVSTAGHCNYNFEASFTSSLGGSLGTRCAVGVGSAAADRGGAITIVTGKNVLTVDTAACSVAASIIAEVPRGLTDPTNGAVLATTFTATATPVKDSNDECAAVTGETEVDDIDTTDGDDATDDDEVAVTLRVLQTPLSVSTETCEYNVVLDISGGFMPTSTRSNEAKVEAESYTALEITPAVAAQNTGEAGIALVAADCDTEVFVSDAETLEVSATIAENTVAVTASCRYNFVELSFSVAVATRQVHILQNVVGDANGAFATYTLTEDKDCGIPADLPIGLSPSSTGGIQVVASENPVELRTGHFEISGAVMNPLEPSTPANRIALSSDADTCVVTAKVSALPAHCSADNDSLTADLASGVDDKNRAIMRFVITCEAAADDMDDGDMDDGDMDDGDMDDGDMDDGDMGDMDDGEVDGGDVGPTLDVPTG